MARKKGIVTKLQDYGGNHPYVTLALAGTFGYYLYDSMRRGVSILPSPASYTSSSSPMSDEAFALMMDDIARIDGVYRVTYGADFSTPSITTNMDQRSAQIIKANLDDALNSRAAMSSAQVAKLEALNTLMNNAYPVNVNGYRRINGLGASTSTTTSSSSSHRMAGPGDGEPSMHIDPTKSGLFGLGATTRANPPAFLKYDQTQQLSGFSPSARRRVGHAGIGMASDSYKATLDTQFHNREAMIMGDLGKHQDILGFSGLEPLAGGDWYE